MSIRVAAIMNTEIVSGPGRQLAAVAKALRVHEVEVVIVCMLLPGQVDSPFTTFLREQALTFRIVRTDGRFRPALVKAIAEALTEIEPHIVQTHSYRPAAVVWWLRRKRPAWRWVGFFHGETREDLKVRAYNLLDRYLLRSADAIVVVAATQLSRFPRRANVLRIPNAVLPAEDMMSGPSRLTTDPLPRPCLGFVGRLSREKGVDVLLDAMALLAARGRHLSLYVAGDGPDRSLLETQAQRLGLASRVLFLGSVKAVSAVYRSVDLLVLPSRTEGMPNVLLEAARLDLPMVATATGDVPDILLDPDAGMMVPPDDAMRLASAIDRALLRGRDARGTAARAAIAQRYSLAERATAHAALYARIGDRHVAA
jgi:glycosyltransferase involved in cell wall biosynthesis